MAKDPAFLFYPNDYIGGTMGMSFEEKGAYMELLMMQFNRGHMTSDMIGHTVGHIWDKLSKKFIQDENGLWYNERLEVEQFKRKSYTNSRHKNRSGKNQYTKDGGHMTTDISGHMEDIYNSGSISDSNTDLYIKEKEIFENFRINYPGTKRGLDTEFLNFTKKHKDWKQVLSLLNPSLDNQIQMKLLMKKNGSFVPEWKMLQTYINNRAWEEEIKVNTSTAFVKQKMTY